MIQSWQPAGVAVSLLMLINVAAAERPGNPEQTATTRQRTRQ